MSLPGSDDIVLVEGGHTGFQKLCVPALNHTHTVLVGDSHLEIEVVRDCEYFALVLEL